VHDVRVEASDRSCKTRRMVTSHAESRYHPARPVRAPAEGPKACDANRWVQSFGPPEANSVQRDVAPSRMRFGAWNRGKDMNIPARTAQLVNPPHGGNAFDHADEQDAHCLCLVLSAYAKALRRTRVLSALCLAARDARPPSGQ
jgi:hypothetical protein